MDALQGVRPILRQDELYNAPATCIVTGAAGLCGRRLVEMLAAAGARKVVGFDRAPRPNELKIPSSCELIWEQGDLANADDVDRAIHGDADCVWHVGALVGPYFKEEDYYRVNYEGTLNVISACRSKGVKKVVMSSSPSTRMNGTSIKWKREEDLEILPPGKFLEPYAETKAMGEVAMRDACDGESFLTVAVAPHQVYGPHDGLFLTNFLKNARRLRVFGSGKNEISMCYVDNYCHALMLGERALYRGSPALGKFYIATDGPPQNLWKVLDSAITALTSSPSLFTRFSLPFWFIMPIAYIVKGVNICCGTTMKLSPFVVRMLTIDRTFDIKNIESDLGYTPLHKFDEAWSSTLSWFDEHRSFWGG